MAGIPRRHHYVTKAYLDGFLLPGEKHLNCYGRKKAQPFSKSPDNLANIRDFHSFKRTDGSIDCSLEVRIEREIETPGIPVLRKLASGNVHLDYAQRLAFARLVALQNVRVPFERDFMDAHHKAELVGYLEEMDDMSRRVGNPVNAIDVAITPRDDPRLIQSWTRLTRSEILAELKEIEEDPGRPSREAFFGVAKHLASVYVDMEWALYLRHDEGSFITSDRPVVLSFTDGERAGRGITDLRAELSFPISSASVLRMNHHNWLLDEVSKRHRNKKTRTQKRAGQGIAILSADDEFVTRFNRALADHAHLWVFSGRKQDWLLNWAQEPAKVLKTARKVSEIEREISTAHQSPKMTRTAKFEVTNE